MTNLQPEQGVEHTRALLNRFSSGSRENVIALDCHSETASNPYTTEDMFERLRKSTQFLGYLEASKTAHAADGTKFVAAYVVKPSIEKDVVSKEQHIVAGFSGIELQNAVPLIRSMDSTDLKSYGCFNPSKVVKYKMAFVDKTYATPINKDPYLLHQIYEHALSCFRIWMFQQHIAVCGDEKSLQLVKLEQMTDQEISQYTSNLMMEPGESTGLTIEVYGEPFVRGVDSH